jgi:hypothetical protein
MAARARHRRGGDQPAGDPSTNDPTAVPEDEPATA